MRPGPPHGCILVRLHRMHRSNVAGETASFPEEEARELVASGAATLVEAKAPEAPPLDKMLRAPRMKKG